VPNTGLYWNKFIDEHLFRPIIYSSINFKKQKNFIDKKSMKFLMSILNQKMIE
jgi:hypothetical protein